MDNKNTINTPYELRDEYKYKKLLGEGSNGKTWLAIRLEDNKRVAIKELKFSKLDNLKSYELFEREVEVLKSLNIDGVPAFYGVVFVEVTHTSYLIQEYIPYPSLQTIIEERKRLSQKEVLSVMKAVAQILSVLQTQYSPAIIHRDLKPSNIMCDLGPKGCNQAVIIDFGAVANPQRRTGGSTVAGTFGYMAPEQMMGDACIQSDYYSLGATALHLITGISPADMPAKGFERKFKQIIKKTAPKTKRPMIDLIERLMAQDPRQRPENARRVLQLIEAVQKGYSVSDDDLASGSGFKHWLRRTYLRLTGRLGIAEGLICGIKTMPVSGSNPNPKKKQTGKQYAIYVFEVNQKSWFGCVDTQILSKEECKRLELADIKIRNESFPIRVHVLYTVSNPAVNRLQGGLGESLKIKRDE